MNCLLIYKLPIMTALTWIVFIILIIVKMFDFQIHSFNGKAVKIEEKRSGTYGKFSFQITVTNPTNDVFTRSYKTLAISNTFINFESLKKATHIWAVVSKSKSNSNKYQLYSIAEERQSGFRIFLEIISFLINNYTLIICIPLVLTLIVCAKEFGADYQFISSQHKALVSKAYMFIALFIALIALY